MIEQGATWDAAYEIAERRLAVELDLIGSVLSRPRDGIAACHGANFSADAISHDDLRLMYVAAEECCQRGKGIILRIIKRALCTSGHWDASARWFERQHRWSDESLASLACSFPGPAHTKHLAAQLMRIDTATREANEMFVAGMRLLREAV